ELNKTGTFITFPGRTFQELIFSPTIPTSYSSSNGSQPLTIKRALTINQHSSLSLTNLSAPVYLEGDLNIYGKLTFTNDLIFNGSDAQNLGGPSETPVQISNLVIDKTDQHLHLA